MLAGLLLTLGTVPLINKCHSARSRKIVAATVPYISNSQIEGIAYAIDQVVPVAKLAELEARLESTGGRFYFEGHKAKWADEVRVWEEFRKNWELLG